MTISSTNRKAGPYIGNGTTTVFPFYFKVFTAADVEVVRLTVATNVETTLAITTDYTVTLNTDQNANPGGSITLVAGALAAGYNLVLTSAIGNLQPTDLTNQGGFYPDVINDALDRATIQIQQLQEGLDRAALLPITSAADSAALVADIIRLADSADNLDIDANNIGSINTVAGAISNVNTVATNIASVNAVAGNATNINAVNANSTNINAVNANKTNIDTVAGNNTNITTVAGISANVTSVAGNSSNINAVAGNATNINAVAGNATNINAVNSNKTNIDTVATNATAVTNVSTNMTAVTSAYTNLAAIQAAPTAATNAANSAAQAAASAASGMYSAVQDKSANYTIVAGDAGDLIRVTTTSGAITITLPLISGVGDGFKIAVVKWTSDSNVVNIARSGSDTINGATSAQIGSQYSQIIFVADLETSQWFASQTGLGATNVNVDVFSGNGSTTGFTLTSDPGTKNNTAMYISGVYQQKSTYSISGTTLTFSTAPPSGTANIEVAYSTPLAIGTPSDGTVTTAKIVDANVTYAKIQNVTAGKVLGRDISGSGVTQELPIAVDTNGNTGIGATTPAAKLHLKGSGTSGQVSASLLLENFSSGTLGADITGSAGSSYARIRYGGGPGSGTNSLAGDAMLIGLEGSSVGVQQIKFAATQVASADANTLDDYEEGTWTPAFGYSGGNGSMSVAYANQYGYYTKIGNLVYFRCDLRFTSFTKGTASGTTWIVGLPFTPQNNGGYGSGIIPINPYQWTITSTPYGSVRQDGVAAMQLQRLVSNSPSVSLDDPDSDAMMFFSGCYQV